MRDKNQCLEDKFFSLFLEYFDSEKDAGRQHDPANYSLERMYPLSEAAGNPERSLKVIHIAGTKGKGTTSHFTSTLLASCGVHVGLFTSPHLSTVRERFQLDNKLVSYECLTKTAVNLLAKIHEKQLHPSLFEIFTVLALRIFADAGMEYAVMETGIGGRLDATNYIPNPEICIITPVSFDHIALLGNTIDKIASEKAGIIKAQVPVVIANQPFELGRQTLLQAAQRQNAPVIPPMDHSISDAFLPPVFPDFLRDNFSVSLAAVRQLGFQPVPSQFQVPELRARFERISDNPLVMLDGAHNADSTAKLVASLNTLYPAVHWTVVLGSVTGKDIHGIVSSMKALNNASFILTNPHTSKGSALELLKQEAAAQQLPVSAVIPDIHSKADLPANTPLLFTGSFFTAVIGEELFHPDET